MNAQKASLINALILLVMGLWGYLESLSPTAMIPTCIGIGILLCNKGIKNQNKVIAHIAVLLTLLSFANIMPLNSALNDDPLRLNAILRVSAMLLTSTIAMIYFIKSFIDARKK